MMFKYLITAVLTVGSAFGALALDLPTELPQLQIYSDLVTAEEIDSINEGTAPQIWLRDFEDDEFLEAAQVKKTQGISLFEP